MGWGVSTRAGVLINGIGCYYTGCGVSFRDGELVNGMGC